MVPPAVPAFPAGKMNFCLIFNSWLVMFMLFLTGTHEDSGLQHTDVAIPNSKDVRSPFDCDHMDEVHG